MPKLINGGVKIDPKTQLILEYVKLLYQSSFQNWIDNVVFTPRWWIILGLLVVPWIVWYRLVYKKRIIEMLAYGLVMSGIILLIDEVGCELTLWTYPVKLIPIFPRLMAISSSLAPTVYMLLYQYFPKWKAFIIANIILSLVFSFILEPILVWMNLYDLVTWKYINSVPTYLFAAILLKLFAEKIKRIQHNALDADIQKSTR